MYKANHVAREVLANLAMKVPAVRQWRVKRGRTVVVAVQEKAACILAQFEFFMDTIGWSEIQDKTVVEIGPGDAVPLAPLFIAAGAKRYVAIDRFLGQVDNDEARALYGAVFALAANGPHAAKLAKYGSVAEVIALLRSDRVELIRAGIEQHAPRQAAGADFIVSFNVCEHLARLDLAVQNMAAILAPAGRMIHRIDYGPHDIWLSYRNPLAFLTIPGPIWKMLSSNRGCPNRVRHAHFLKMARALGLSATDRIGRRADEGAVAQARPHLSGEFRALSDDEIGVLDAEIVLSFAPEPSLGRGYVEQN